MTIRGIVTGVVVGAIVVAAQAPSFGGSDDPAFSHAQLERDRLTAELMATAVGDPMNEEMAGLLERSRNEEYLQALEAHTRQYEQMMGMGSSLP